MRKKVAALVVVVVVATLSVVGCINTPTSPQASNVAKGLEVQATPVANPPQALGARWKVTPKSGNVYVAFDCTVKNINAQPLRGQSQTYISLGYWHLVDRQGKIYSSLFGDALVEESGMKAFGFRYTSPGDVVNGYVFFEVPANHSAWNYIYYDDGGAHMEIPL